jgi:hypothetical protein
VKCSGPAVAIAHLRDFLQGPQFVIRFFPTLFKTAQNAAKPMQGWL